MHTLISEDRGHPREAEIYSKIDEIIRRIKEVGYHSEKLVVALGSLASQIGAPIQMFKNEFVEIVLL